MAAPSLTYSLTNGSTADAAQVMQNFNDLLNGYTDGTKDLSISALTCAGTATLNGHVNLGNSTADDLTITGSLASTIAIKTTNSYNIGSATLGLAGIYFGTSDSDTVRIVAAGTMAASRTYTLPDAGAAADFVMTAGTQTVAGAKTFSTSITLATSGGTATALNYYEEHSHSSTWQGNGGGTVSSSASIIFTRVGDLVTMTVPATTDAQPASSSTVLNINSAFPSRFRPSAALNVPILVYNNGSLQTTGYGYAQITTAGGIDIRRDPSNTAFTNSAGAGFAGFCLSWSV